MTETRQSRTWARTRTLTRRRSGAAALVKRVLGGSFFMAALVASQAVGLAQAVTGSPAPGTPEAPAVHGLNPWLVFADLCIIVMAVLTFIRLSRRKGRKP